MIVAALALCASAGGASAQPSAATPPPTSTAPAPQPTGRPQWQTLPDGDALRAFYPPRALELNSAGSATITCTATANGSLADCRVASETPEDIGFGEAALRLSAQFRMQPTTTTGAPVAGMVLRIPIRFRLPDSQEPIDIAALCYAMAAQAIDQEFHNTVARNAMIYWSSVHARLMLSANARPSQIEAAQARARVADISAPGYQRFRTACFTLPTANFPYGDREP